MVQLYFATLKQQGAHFTTWFPDLNVTVRGEKYEIFTKCPQCPARLRFERSDNAPVRFRDAGRAPRCPRLARRRWQPHHRPARRRNLATERDEERTGPAIS